MALHPTSTRSKALSKNIIRSAIYKGANVLFNFLVVREAIAFFGKDDYGIWLAVLAFFTWFSSLEFGVSSSLRNNITKSYTDEKLADVKAIITKGYVSLGYIFLLVILLFVISLFFTPIEHLFIGNNKTISNLTFVLLISSILYFSHFIFFYLHGILLAVHYARSTYLIVAIQNAILLLGLIMFRKFEFNPSLLLICVWFSFVPFIVWLVASIICYSNILKDIRPSLRSIHFSFRDSFKGLNRSFFIIQVCTLIIFSTDNIIIVNYLNSTEVSIYNVVFKYFNLLLVIFNLIIVPFWASFTESYYKNDRVWIVNSFKKLILFWIGILILGLIMVIIYRPAIQLWIGEDLSISFSLILYMCASVLLTSWNNIFIFFLRAITKVNLQMKLVLFSAIINIPLSIYLINYFNSTGVIIATCIALLPLSILLPIQCYSVLKKMPAH